MSRQYTHMQELLPNIMSMKAKGYIYARFFFRFIKGREIASYKNQKSS